ncbi:MAG: hypothetical protein JW776_08410 [Candidatus Lokiarchaeota archaeon]|nr:hypothetical protein [Candidatus Lokiarchaeota archaeon]
MGIANGFMKTKKKNPEPVAYVCDNCGAKATVVGDVPRCLGCGKQLCNICNVMGSNSSTGLCSKCFNTLENKDQRKIKRTRNALDSAKVSKNMFTIAPIVMGAIAVILLVLMVILRQDIFYFLFGFLGGFLLLCSLMILCVFHNIEEREKERISRQIRDILMPYHIKQVAMGPTKIEVIQCPHCGGNIASTAEICEWCGSTLRETPMNL